MTQEAYKRGTVMENAMPTKSEIRRARRAARAAGQPLTGELALDRGTSPVDFTESARGYRARERWARRYDELNGAPENDFDR